MVRAWLMADAEGADRRLPHTRSPSVPVSLTEIKNRTGVLHCKIDPAGGKEELETIKKNRGYNYQDVVDLSPETLPDFENKMNIFYTEHIHNDEEIRYVLAGSGYFEIRDKDDQWIRIGAEAGDLIILPAGLYHRFTLDTKNYMKAMRMFSGDPVWTAYFRPAADVRPAAERRIRSRASVGMKRNKPPNLTNSSCVLMKKLKRPADLFRLEV